MTIEITEDQRQQIAGILVGIAVLTIVRSFSKAIWRES
jgi:hypothetical protein